MTRIDLFSRYLTAVGFELSPMAWHMSGLGLNDSQHSEVIALLGGSGG